MGCPSSKQANSQKTDHQFVILARRLSYQFEQQSSQLHILIERKKQKLKSQLSIDVGSRSRQKQMRMMQQLVYNMHLKMIYDYLAIQCKFLLDRSRYIPLLFLTRLDQYQQKQKEAIKQPILIILFSISIINDGKLSLKNSDIANFEKMAQSKFNQIQAPSKVQYELLNYYKTNQIPHIVMIKQFAFELCAQENIMLSKFHEVGHPFTY